LYFKPYQPVLFIDGVSTISIPLDQGDSENPSDLGGFGPQKNMGNNGNKLA
jgi:hypothetical protein